MTASLLHRYLGLAREAFATVDRVIGAYGDQSLGEYAGQVTLAGPPGWQPVSDLGEAVHRYAAPLLGEDLASRAATALMATPVALTSSHHGLDCFAQTFQGRMIFALGALARPSSPAIVTVLSCGSVPLDNQTFPRGLLAYDGQADAIDDLPMKLPLFSNRFRRMLVSTCPPFDRSMIERATSLAAAMQARNEITAATATAVDRLTAACLDPIVLALENYSKQATVLNHRIWNSCLTSGAHPQETVYLEMEKIVALLLETDLVDPDSLICRLLLSTDRLLPLIAALDGVNGCWQNAMTEAPMTGGSGTVFFWGIDGGGRRIPMGLVHGPDGHYHLKGRDGEKGSLVVALRPADLLTGLHQHRILPSLFTCFLSLALARGVVCVGGYYQCAYLRRMQAGVARVLAETGATRELCETVAAVPTDRYIDGMAGIFKKIDGGCLVPAGPLEIMAAGALSAEELSRFGSLTVTQAHLGDMFETVLDAVGPQEMPPGLRKSLAEETGRVLYDKAVIR